MTIHDRTHRRRHRLALPLTAILTVLIGAPLVGAPSPAAAAAVATQAPAAATADAVLTWDVNAQTAIWDVARQQPKVQARSFAMVHGAVYDAVNAIAGKPYQPYLVAPPATGTESIDAAVATAAHQVLAVAVPGPAGPAAGAVRRVPRRDPGRPGRSRAASRSATRPPPR